MRRNLTRLLISVLTLSIVASACGGGGKGPEDTVKDIRDSDAKDVKPPDKVDPKQIAFPGLQLSTNSPTWQDLIRSPNGRGAVVLFVQPNAPAAGKGIARGDLLTEVDGTAVTNFEHALTLLRSARGEARKLKLVGRTGKERTLEIKGDLPRERPRPVLDEMIKGNPNDPVLRYLRAQSSDGTLQQNLDDLNKALTLRPDFVEALAYRGSLLFNSRLLTKDDKVRKSRTTEALANWRNALDTNPRHAETLTVEANALIALGRAATAKTEALKALRVDPLLPSANNALAKANLALKKPADAAGPALAAIVLNPYSNLTYYRTLAVVFKQLKRKADCAATLNSVVPYLEGTRSPALKKEAKHIADVEAKKNCG